MHIGRLQARTSVVIFLGKAGKAELKTDGSWVKIRFYGAILLDAEIGRLVEGYTA